MTKRAVVISRCGMGEGDPALSMQLLEKYFSCSLENKDIKDYYLFYNSGVCAAFQSESIIKNLQSMQEQGAEIFFCGTCLEFYHLAHQLTVGKMSCMNDIRIAMNTCKTDFL
jgi:hypothetical protein